ncbi:MULTISPECIES: response regulator transcription factor [unclassified Rhizobium]|jgi:two-component system response regulator FixJ|uniref:response regulator transcription factor n=1 Tax=unclassified Rhizobium TaxID=2613769 RepID=UPI000DDB7F10|nr:LuxR C-terminal-related transcriptional regulator [Rhizobium sp. UBA1881]
MANDLTVHLVDDQEIPRRSLTFLLISSGFAVRAYESASAFLDQLPVSGRACLVKVTRMSCTDGLQLLERLNALNANIPTILVGGDGDVETAVQAMKAGAADFIKKPFEDQALIAAINQATSRRAPPSQAPVDTEMVASRLRQLTDREHQVLAAVLDGLQNKMIAFNLGISARTVEVHRANVMAKMEARNLAELLRMVLTSGGMPHSPATRGPAPPAVPVRLL